MDDAVQWRVTRTETSFALLSSPANCRLSIRIVRALKRPNLLASLAGWLNARQEHWLSALRTAPLAEGMRRNTGVLKHVVALAGKNDGRAPTRTYCRLRSSSGNFTVTLRNLRDRTPRKRKPINVIAAMSHLIVALDLLLGRALPDRSIGSVYRVALRSR